MTDISEKKMYLYELVYLLYFAVMFGAKSAGLYEGMLVYNASIVVGMLLFGIKVLMTEHTLLEYIIIICLLGMSMAVYACSGEKGLLFFVTMMLGMKGVELVKVEKLGVVILATCFAILTFINVFGFVDGRYAYSANRFFFKGTILRHFLGYPSCNVTHTTFTILSMLIILAMADKIKKHLPIALLFLYVINIYIYFYDISETGLLVTSIFFLMLIYYVNREKIVKFDAFLVGVTYIGCLILVTVIPAFLSEKMIAYLDVFLHDRVLFLNRRLTQEPLTAFGQRIAITKEVYETLDSNSYAYLLVQLGVIPYVVMAAIMLFTIVQLVKKNRKIELAIIMSLCLLGLSDAFMYNLSYKNIIFLFSGECLFSWLEEKESFLPFLNTRFQIIKLGSYEISYERSVLYKAVKAVGRLFASVIEIKGWKHFFAFVVIALAIFGITSNTVDFGEMYTEIYKKPLVLPVSTQIESIIKWECISRALSLGVWISGAIILVMTLLDLKKRKN